MSIHNLLFIVMLAWCCKSTSEIILPGSNTSSTSNLERSSTTTNNAADMRAKAQASARTNDSPIPVGSTILIIPEGDDDVLSRARANSSSSIKMRDTHRSTTSNSTSPIVIIYPENPSNDNSRLNLERNLNKSRQYSESSSYSHEKVGTHVKSGTSVGVMGADGVLVFNCEKTNNTMGRIGDDSLSGNIFNISINNKTLKARCK